MDGPSLRVLESERPVAVPVADGLVVAHPDDGHVGGLPVPCWAAGEVAGGSRVEHHLDPLSHLHAPVVFRQTVLQHRVRLDLFCVGQVCQLLHECLRVSVVVFDSTGLGVVEQLSAVASGGQAAEHDGHLRLDDAVGVIRVLAMRVVGLEEVHH